MITQHRARSDGLPEGMFGRGNFLDTGCEVAPSCLACPLPVCRYDRPGGARSIIGTQRNEEIRQHYEVTGDAGAIAAQYGLSVRTVYRALKDQP